jgi:hypothetical protein
MEPKIHFLEQPTPPATRKDNLPTTMRTTDITQTR